MQGSIRYILQRVMSLMGSAPALVQQQGQCGTGAVMQHTASLVTGTVQVFI